jgi:WD40 repeat protein
MLPPSIMRKSSWKFPPLFVLWVLCWSCLPARSQTYDTNGVVVQTFVGSGFYGHYDGVGQQTMFNAPSAVVADSGGNLFVLDSGNRCLRKVTTNGVVSTFAGGGEGSLPGYGTNVSLGYSFYSMAIDRTDSVWLSIHDGQPSLLRINKDGYVTRVQGMPGSLFGGLCFDSSGNLYASDSNNQKIYRCQTNGLWELFVGSGNEGSADGNWIFTSFSNPAAMAADSAGYIYVWDSGTRLVRRVSQGREVTTIAGKANGFSQTDGVGRDSEFINVLGMCFDGFGNLILASGSSVRRISAATNVTTLAGSFDQYGFMNGPGSLARFKSASGICFSRGQFFVTDSGDHRIRNLSFSPDAQPVSGGSLDLSLYPGLKISGVVGRSYRVESSTNMISWSTETTVLLTRTPYLWINEDSLGQKKFYRALLLP